METETLCPLCVNPVEFAPQRAKWVVCARHATILPKARKTIRPHAPPPAQLSLVEPETLEGKIREALTQLHGPPPWDFKATITATLQGVDEELTAIRSVISQLAIRLQELEGASCPRCSNKCVEGISLKDRGKE